MQSTVVLALLDAHTAAPEAASPEAALTTLPAVFASVPDPRSRHGQRYDLPFLLTCLVAALLCGCDSLEAVAGDKHVDEGVLIGKRGELMRRKVRTAIRDKGRRKTNVSRKGYTIPTKGA